MLQRAASAGSARIGGTAGFAGASAADEESTLHEFASGVSSTTVRIHSTSTARSKESVECGVDQIANRSVRASHEAFHPAERAEEVTAIDSRRPAKTDDEVLGEVGHADHLMGNDLADRYHHVPSRQQDVVDLDGDGIRHPAAGQSGHLGRADLPEPGDAVPPPMAEDAVEGDPLVEEQRSLIGGQRARGSRAPAAPRPPHRRRSAPRRGIR